MKSFLLFLLLINIADAIRPTLTFGRPVGGLLQIPDQEGDVYTDEKYLTYSTFTQASDNFNDSNKDTWQQRYQYNSKFQDFDTGLVFLMLGGEGRIGDKWVKNENVSMMQWAAKYKAAAFQVEHRFYGPPENTPYKSQDTATMRLLTIDQALADIHNFINGMNDKYFKGHNMRWVTFGGSYPGTLSALFRQKYPQDTIGAVSTSSAVHFFVDYFGYAVNTENNYRMTDNDCAKNIQTAFQAMSNLMYSGVEGRKNLKGIFNLCTDFDENNIVKASQFFFDNVYGVFQGINQYSGDNRPPSDGGLGVPGACQIMVNKTIGTEMQRVKAVWDYYNVAYGINGCNANNYTDFVKTYGDTSYPDDEDVVSTRSWIWQTCTELGYFQTTDGGNGGIFGSTVPVDFFSDQCIDLFGKQFTLDKIYSMVDQNRKIHNMPDQYNGTNVAFPNGNFDPWKSLGIVKGANYDKNNLDIFNIDGTAHCADMYPARDSDLQSLKDARERISRDLQSWIVTSTPTIQTTTPSGGASSLTTLMAVIPLVIAKLL